MGPNSVRSIVPLFVLVFAAAFASNGARGADGVLEINQTCATQGGCFAGDGAGYPVTITSAAGRSSFRLTSDLLVPNESIDGVLVSVSNVSVDLGGFTIIRAACVGAPSNCTPSSGAGDGISAAGLQVTDVSVANGSIVGMGQFGVRLNEGTEARRLRIRWSRSEGILTSEGSTVADNVIRDNGGTGIIVGLNSIASGNTIVDNAGDGLVSLSGASFSNNTVGGNDGIGINAGATSVVTGNAVYANTGVGIRGSLGTLVEGNTLRSNQGGGIHLDQAAVIRDNVVSRNELFGIQTGYLAEVVDNSLDGNVGPAISVNDGSNVSRNTVGAITSTFSAFPGIVCGAGCAVFDNLVRNTSQAMTLGSGSRFGRNVLTLTPTPAVTGSGVSAGDNLCNGTAC